MLICPRQFSRTANARLARRCADARRAALYLLYLMLCQLDLFDLFALAAQDPLFGIAGVLKRLSWERNLAVASVSPGMGRETAIKKPASPAGGYHLVKTSLPRHPMNGGKNSCIHVGHNVFHPKNIAQQSVDVQPIAAHPNNKRPKYIHPKVKSR
ncbi:hypothetical protein [Thalassospira lucentensis]|uniref:hypothetical protein n=1 Tax=Thalassospira lucentensis TaxID=168935 RepID=UPI0020CA5CA9|nr:hypothetical protein [Thalassospira lucentensis]